MRQTGVAYRLWRSEDLARWEEMVTPSRTVTAGAEAVLQSVPLPASKGSQFVRLEFVAPPSP